MSVTMPRAMLMAFLLAPSLSWALGLGEIHLYSALNEPMSAEIDLIAAAPDEVAALRASLASREAFTRYGIDKPAFLSSLTFKVGKGKDGREALLVRSTDAIPDPFVTFLVEVNWARGRLMREYTVLLDPPVYTPGDPARAVAAVAAPTTAAPLEHRATATASAPANTTPSSPSAASASAASPTNTIQVGPGDTLTRIAHGLRAEWGSAAPADVDQTMIALYRANPTAFGRNINVLRRGSILRVPSADQIASLNQKEAMNEVHRQMESWRASDASGASSSGHLRLVTPTAGGAATASTRSGLASANSSAETQELRDRVKNLEAQLLESKRLIDIRSSELSALQRKLGAPAAAALAATTPPATAPAVAVAVAPPATTASAVVPPAGVPVAANAVTKKPLAVPVESGSWLDWVAANWWVPVAILVLVACALIFAAMRRRRDEDADMSRFLEETDVAERRDPTSKLHAPQKNSDAFVVQESGPHVMPDFNAESGRFGDTGEIKTADDTMSSESAVNLDQGDPLAEADFHMAYGLYDQAADLVRIALEGEPERRDLRLKLLEIYFVWGNKDAFLQTAKGLEATRDRAPPGDWDKIVIMGKQICPDEAMFGSAAGSGRGAGALVDLNLEGGENRVDIDLFGDPEGERSTLDSQFASASEEPAARASDRPGHGASLHTGDDLDFMLDAPERGADESPTRQMPPRDEPTVESELMNFGDANFFDAPVDAPSTESPSPRASDMHDRIASKLPSRADQTAEVSIDDLGLDLDDLERTSAADVGVVPGAAAHRSADPVDAEHFDLGFEEREHSNAEHPADAPTMVAGLNEHSRRMIADAETSARDRDLTELERELEASFIVDLEPDREADRTSVLAPESAPTVQVPRAVDQSPTSRFQSLDAADSEDGDQDPDSTSRLRSLDADSIDLDLDRLASALGSGDTFAHPRAAEDLFSSEVFEGTQRNKLVDLDVGEAPSAADEANHILQTQTNKLKPIDFTMPEMEPVTMSEVGTKLDLARAYMDMGDPEGARSILDEVVQEGSASQKQEASRLIESLPG